jgi:hypothetical protein
MIRMLLFLLGISELISPRLWAKSCAELALKEAEDLDPNIPYQPYICSENVRKVIDHFATKGEDLSRAKVVFVLHELAKVANGPTAKVGLNLMEPRSEYIRSGNSRLSVSYHVFLDKGFVIDLDARVKVRERKVYVSKMYDRNAGAADAQKDPNFSLSNIKLIEIPVPDYIEKFNQFDTAPYDPVASRQHGKPIIPRAEWIRGEVVTFFREQAGKAYPIKSMAEYATSNAHESN